MPRQSRGGGAPGRSGTRPTVAPSRPVAPPQPQSRPATTAAHPPAAAHPPQQQMAPQPTQSAGPGLFGQMASTAAGVAVGSSIGHAIGGMFGGGSSAPVESASPAAPAEQSQYSTSSSTGGVCHTEIGHFRKCMDENQGSLNICGWYLDQLKACQQAASQY